MADAPPRKWWLSTTDLTRLCGHADGRGASLRPRRARTGRLGLRTAGQGLRGRPRPAVRGGSGDGTTPGRRRRGRQHRRRRGAVDAAVLGGDRRGRAGPVVVGGPPAPNERLPGGARPGLVRRGGPPPALGGGRAR